MIETGRQKQEGRSMLFYIVKNLLAFLNICLCHCLIFTIFVSKSSREKLFYSLVLPRIILSTSITVLQRWNHQQPASRGRFNSNIASPKRYKDF